jgi:lipid A disaccharide synthetase
VTGILAEHHLPVNVTLADAAPVMAACDAGLVTSGTATLQAVLAGMPHAVVYKLDKLSWWFAFNILKPLVMDKDLHVAIANVLAISQEKLPEGPIQELHAAGFSIHCLECRRPLLVPELLQDYATPESLASWLDQFRSSPELRSATLRGFGHIRAMLTPKPDGMTPGRVVLECLDGK